MTCTKVEGGVKGDVEDDVEGVSTCHSATIGGRQAGRAKERAVSADLDLLGSALRTRRAVSAAQRIGVVSKSTAGKV